MYKFAVIFATLTATISVLNDIITKLIPSTIPIEQVTFLRFFFSLITLIPFITKQSILSLQYNVRLQILRGVIGALAIGIFIYALHFLPLPEVTVLSFTQILFFMPISAIFLKEKVPPQLIWATILGFVGVLIFFMAPLHIQPAYFLLLFSSLLFAILDMIAKKMVEKTSFFSMLLYFALITTLAAAPFAWRVWVPMQPSSWITLCVLGAGANLIQITLFRALQSAAANLISPFRYLEIIFSFLAGHFFFHESISTQAIMGSVVIILSTQYIARRL